MSETQGTVPTAPEKNIKLEERPRRSDSIAKLAAALAKAQGEMENAEKDVKGNFGKYATLAATWDVLRKPLSSNGIAVYQRILTLKDKPHMCTMLIHSSGEFLDDCELEMIFDRTGGRITPMQAMGSAVTYSRRYSLQAVAGVAPADDDDGAGAGTPRQQQQKPQAQGKPAPAADPAKPPAAQKPNNQAPATQKMIDMIHGLCMDRQVQESEINYLITKGYGITQGIIPTWVANEIIKLLENEDCTSTTVMAESQRVISRREAARIKAESEGGK